jgi:hypothetical protein
VSSKEGKYQGVDWIQLAEDKDQWRVLEHVNGHSVR